MAGEADNRGAFATQRKLCEAMAAARARATANAPLAWVTMEPDRVEAHQVIRVRCWPAGIGLRTLAAAHAHGTWIRTSNDRDDRSLGREDGVEATQG